MNLKKKDGTTKMATKNDDRILTLKKEISNRREELKNKNTRFTPVTNCILTLHDKTYNINTLTKDELMCLSMSLRLMIRSADDLFYDLTLCPILNGYTIPEWFEDVKSKIKYIEYQETKKRLDALEKELNALLSNDKQTELKIDELEKILGNNV